MNFEKFTIKAQQTVQEAVVVHNAMVNKPLNQFTFYVQS